MRSILTKENFFKVQSHGMPQTLLAREMRNFDNETRAISSEQSDEVFDRSPVLDITHTFHPDERCSHLNLKEVCFIFIGDEVISSLG